MFDIFENGTGTLNSGVTTAKRGFAAPLGIGQTFSFSDVLHFGRSGVDGISEFGFNLQNAAGMSLVNLAVNGGGAGYLLTDPTHAAVLQSGLNYNYNAATTFSFTLDDALGNYTLTATGTAVTGGSITINSQISLAGGVPTAFAIYNNDGGGGSDVQFSNLSVTTVPEPVGLAAIAGIAVPMLRRRR